jgi:hypothetical protein
MDRDRQEQEERPSESEPNPTQERIDDEGGGDRPVDVPWTDEDDSKS